MKKISGSIGDGLVSEGLITNVQLKQIESEIERTHEPIQKILKRLRFIDESKWISFLSKHFGIPRIEVSHQIIKPEILQLVPEDLIRKFGIFPLIKVGKRLTVAMSDPLNLTVIDQLRIKTGFEIDVVLATDSEIRGAIEHNYGLRGEMTDMVQPPKQAAGGTKTQKPSAEPRATTTEEAPVVKLVKMMISNAIRDKASDIHVEPGDESVLIRYRVDGILREVDKYPVQFHPGVTSRIKIMANLDIAETRIPQDGRVSFNSDGQMVDLRISFVPTIHGENIVLRLLNTQAPIFSLDDLGMTSDKLKLLQSVIHKDYGIFLITGPTGSGKTTTLYASLHQINSIERNIITIEDPVEYHLPLIRQIQVNPKVDLTFAAGLRSVLRQDPDVIMIGEIRDRETAEIAVRAALTGHLVFSTLHTNNAASAISRLLDMGIEPFLIASASRGIMAQRLVRKICKNCKEEIKTSPADLERLKILGVNPAGFSQLYRGKGCLACRKSGYEGRIGLFEIFAVDDAIRSLILKRASSAEIAVQAVKTGMETLLLDGIQKIKEGITTIEEVLRVTQE